MPRRELQLFGSKKSAPLNQSVVRRIKRSLFASTIVCTSVATQALTQETTSYAYDPLGRVTTVQRSGGPANGATTNYSYDPASNRTGVVISNSSNGSSSDTGSGATNNGSGQQQVMTALNPTLPTFPQSTTGNVISISSLATLNGRSGSITSFALPAGAGSASISSGGQSISYSTPYVGSSCDIIPVNTYSVNYVVSDSASGNAVTGVATLKVKGTKLPIKSCTM